MYDVIVVGAGPAGNMAALRLADLGHKVAVVDWRHNLGDKLCTGIIGSECAQRFPPQPGHVYHAATAATVVSPAGRRYAITREQRQAYIVNRVAYVGSLAQQAAKAGASYFLGVRVTGIEVAGDGAAVQSSGGGTQETLRSEVVIIASGFGSPLLQMIGMKNDEADDFMIGSQAEVKTSGLEQTEVYLGESVSPGSFGWLVPLSDSRAFAGIISHSRHNGHMGKFLSTLESCGKVREVIKRPQRWGIPLKPLPKTYGNRILVAGDAAGFAKPTTGGGIYYALLSGEMAAGTVHQAFGAGDFSAQHLRYYEKQWKASFGKELRMGYYARTLYEALGDRQIERLLGLICEVQDELVEPGELSFDRHSRLIVKALGHGRLGPMLKAVGPAIVPLLLRLGSRRFH